MLPLQDFIDYLNAKVSKSVYVWGGQGQKGNEITEAWIRKKDTSETDAKRSIDFWNKLKKAMDPNEIWAFDCSGLGIYFLHNLMGVLKKDYTADGMMGLCEKITRSQLRKGDWVFKVNSSGKATHIGYVVDDALNVVEAKGRDYGVIKSHVSKSSWNAYGRPPFFDYDLEGDNLSPIIRAATCTGDGVNIRNGRNSVTESLGKVNKGHLLVAGELLDNWVPVATVIGIKPVAGYMFKDYVSK